MIANDTMNSRPLWLLIEDRILKLNSDDLSPDKLEDTIRQTAVELDNTGYNVSRHAGHMLELRWAVEARIKVGRPMLNDFGEAVAALTLDDVNDPYTAAVKIIKEVGEAWPKLKQSDRKPDVLKIVEKTRLELLVSRAKELSGEDCEPGIRFLLAERLTPEIIVERMEISEEEFSRVNAAVEAELAERVRVKRLVKEAEGKSDEDKLKGLIINNVSDELILELAGVEQAAIDGARSALEEELAEQRRLAEEEAARKKAEAEGPPIEEIPSDQLLEYIESVREILEFSDVEAEIRTMCDQSSIPKALVDLAVSEPDKLDDLEANAGG